MNFVNGNSDADPEQEVISRWRIEQCSELSAVSASFVLATPTETDGAVFPGVSCWRIPVCGLTVLMSVVTRAGQWLTSSTNQRRISGRTNAASVCAGVSCATIPVISAVSFPSINFLSKSMTQTESAILAHARRCAPAESCGFVVRTPEGDRYLPSENISGEPEERFRMAPEDWLRAQMQGEIVALVHSHPGGLPWLSEADRRLQVQE